MRTGRVQSQADKITSKVTMRPPWLHCFALSAVLILGGVDTALSKDLCCTGLNDTSIVFIFPKFKMPSAGQCKPVNGYQAGFDSQLVGTVCMLTDGSAL